jgi:primase-polymerase (primpol)-like protein
MLLNCHHCQESMLNVVRRDAQFCSTKCRVAAYRKQLRIPVELIQTSNWIRFTDNVRKIPIQSNGNVASVDDPTTWSDFDSVIDSYNGVGLGFVFNQSGIMGIDLDNALGLNGHIKLWAREIISKFPDTYIEKSPSKKGLHILLRGGVEQGRRFRVEDGVVEYYSDRRYFTVTGNRYKNAPVKLSLFENVGELIGLE